MRHNLTFEGLSFRLRPVNETDAAFIVNLRNDSSMNSWLHPISSQVEDQLAWLVQYFNREGDWYFVVERLDGYAEGLISLYDQFGGTAEWGRWVLRSGSLAAVESAWLIYKCAFECLGLDAVYCRTVVANKSVVSFHDSCGVYERSLLPAHVELRGQRFDSIEHRLSRAAWPVVD